MLWSPASTAVAVSMITALAATGPASAQDAPQVANSALRPGVAVRVWHPEASRYYRAGILERLTTDSLAFRYTTGLRIVRVTLVLDSVARLDVVARPSRRVRGFVYGAGAALGAIGLVMIVGTTSGDGSNGGDETFGPLGVAAMAFVVAVATGAVVAALSPGIRWRQIPVTGRRVGRAETPPSAIHPRAWNAAIAPSSVAPVLRSTWCAPRQASPGPLAESGRTRSAELAAECP